MIICWLLPSNQRCQRLIVGYKVRPFLNLLLNKYRNAYTPSQNLSIDESMISLKGRLSLLQFLPKKPHKWVMKVWVLADSLNSYTWGGGNYS